MAGPPPRKAARDERPPAKQKERKPRPTKGERTALRAVRRKERRAHRAGVRAIRREQARQAWEWVWPAHTRDVGRPRSVLILVLNIAPFPGLGTALYGRPERGLLQFALTFLFLIGWVWAIADGARIVQRAFAGPPRRPRHPPRRQPRP